MRIYAPLNSEAQPTLQSIEVSLSLQIPSFQIIGLPAPEVAEARERVRAAILSSGFEFPRKRVVVNLSPANLRKRGTGLDLAVALAILAKAGRLPSTDLLACSAWGELGLDGTLKPAGQLTRGLYSAFHSECTHLIMPAAEVKEASQRLLWIQSAAMNPQRTVPPVILSARNLKEAWECFQAVLRGQAPPPQQPCLPAPDRAPESALPPLLPIPPSLERLLGVAAAGSHHLLLLGPRGTGKSHAVEWLLAIQPPVTSQLRLSNALLAELANGDASGLRKRNGPPVRRVGAQARPAALLGGAHSLHVRPGEASLAHGGILVADELPEWPRDTRETLREPLERGKITLTRASGSIELPARFTLVANGNLCPCGGWPPQIPIPIELQASGARAPACQCSPSNRKNYLRRLSGPILDRIDLMGILCHPSPPKGDEASLGSRASELRRRVFLARQGAIEKWGHPPGEIPADQLEALLCENPEWKAALEPLALSSLRSRHKVIRLALTLAAWDGKEAPLSAHFTEAFCYRPERFGLCE